MTEPKRGRWALAGQALQAAGRAGVERPGMQSSTAGRTGRAGSWAAGARGKARGHVAERGRQLGAQEWGSQACRAAQQGARGAQAAGRQARAARRGGRVAKRGRRAAGCGRHAGWPWAVHSVHSAFFLPGSTR